MESVLNSPGVRAPSYTVMEQLDRYDSAGLEPHGGAVEDGPDKYNDSDDAAQRPLERTCPWISGILPALKKL